MVEPGPGFRPPHCPRAECEYHRHSRGWRFKKDGFHTRAFDGRRIQRYRCSHCRRSFSTQTFSTTYWLKRPDLPLRLLAFDLSCGAFRQAARALRVSPSTVALQIARLGRHMLLFHERYRPRQVPAEPLVIDGFETFEFSQYWVTHLNCVVGADSHFVYATTAAELRRKGRMTARQKARRQALEARYGRPDPRSIETRMAEALALAVPPGGEVELRSDEHRAYPQALRHLRDRRFHHTVTPSRAARTPGNPLFPVNLLDLLLRHSGSHQKRETIAFSKRNQSMLWREAIFRVWRNWVKHVSERRQGGTPAMRLRLVERRLGWEEILARRLFPSHLRLRGPLAGYYAGRVPTRQIPRARAHTLRYAY